MIFESHAHYDDKAFDSDRDKLLKSMPENGVGYILNAGSSMKSISKTFSLMENYPFIYGAFGIHPSDTAKLNEENFKWLKNQFKASEKVVAVGEIGLDYYWDDPDRETQKIWFVRQLELAGVLNLPVIVHSREAAKDTLDTLRAQKAGQYGGVMHCFSYTKETARECLKMNFHIGIGGVVTFKNAQKLKEVAAYTPLDRILIETDCPYLAPVPFRGKRNTSAYLPNIAEEIAKVKGISYEEVIQKTAENALKLFKITI
ncbi:MAG: TatD family hydrolase [Lachnospiraceae bacterium]|nr:TatD family hydrolase [Lachnospiraceae bacterium]